MKEKMYRLAPLILAAGGLITWLITFTLDRYYNHSQVLIWIPFVMIIIFAFCACGALIIKLYLEAHTDKLTGLGNRAFFDDRFSSLRLKGPLSILLIDLDNFKRINDTYGHVTGDSVLREFAMILQQCTRRSDIIARWGGEEFVVILPDTNAVEAYTLAERIRGVVEEYHFGYGMNSCSITISIGLASSNGAEGIQTEELLKNADEALYEAKKKKNKIITHSAMPVAK